MSRIKTFLFLVFSLNIITSSLLFAQGNVTHERLMDEEDGSNWLSWGRTYKEQRFSPLTEINESTVEDLGLAWYFDLDTFRGVEGTPLLSTA